MHAGLARIRVLSPLPIAALLLGFMGGGFTGCGTDGDGPWIFGGPRRERFEPPSFVGVDHPDCERCTPGSSGECMVGFVYACIDGERCGSDSPCAPQCCEGKPVPPLSLEQALERAVEDCASAHGIEPGASVRVRVKIAESGELDDVAVLDDRPRPFERCVIAAMPSKTTTGARVVTRTVRLAPR